MQNIRVRHKFKIASSKLSNIILHGEKFCHKYVCFGFLKTLKTFWNLFIFAHWTMSQKKNPFSKDNALFHCQTSQSEIKNWVSVF